jgi:hypothetical protein
VYDMLEMGCDDVVMARCLVSWKLRVCLVFRMF